MKKRAIVRLIFGAAFFVSLTGTAMRAEDTEARIIRASSQLFGPATSKEEVVSSLVEFLDVTIALTVSSEYADEIKHHLDVAKDLFENSSIFNEKAHQYLCLAYRMVTSGTKYQMPAELDDFVTPAESREKSMTYAKKLVKEACASIKESDDGKAAKLILELVLMIVTPISG